jgi:hypothetical protein
VIWWASSRRRCSGGVAGLAGSLSAGLVMPACVRVGDVRVDAIHDPILQ